MVKPNELKEILLRQPAAQNDKNMTNNFRLSILICSIQRRLMDLALLAWKLEQQVNKIEKQMHKAEQISLRDRPVEILWLGDNRSMSVGEKRNKLLALSKGEYVCFIDDDDIVEDDYVEQILKGIEQKPDVVCFNVGFRNAEIGGDELPALFSIKNVFNQNFEDRRIRMPNHLMAVKREHALKVGFSEKSFGEDTDYGLRLRGKTKAEALLKTEYHCNKVLYHYRFDPHKSATHHLNPLYRKPVSEPMIKMDVVMVSDGTNPALREMTQRAIDSIISDDVNVIVLEKHERIRYKGADTFLQKQPFNYNQCLNDGATMGNAEYICFTNNDVLFPEGFVSDVIEEMSAHVFPIQNSEFNIQHSPQGSDVLSVKNQHGFIHPDIISGFCFVMRRDTWVRIGKLNTDYRFWCADNVTTEQIKKYELKECRSDIKVTHFTSVSLNYLDASTREDYTSGCVKKFNKDFGKNVLNLGI